MPKPKDEEFTMNNVLIDFNRSGSSFTGPKALINVDELLKNTPSKQVTKSRRRLAKDRKIERAKTKGELWFNMPAQKLTDNVKKDLEILKMRSALDPKRFYKKNDLDVLPKYFQIGHVIDSPADYYSSRVPKKERKKTIVEELLADAEFQRKNKKKYNSIVHENIKLSRFKRRKE